MGEAKRKKQLMAASSAQLAELRPDILATAVRQVVRACTDFHGADCLLFAAIGAGALQHFGVPAKPVAGSAIWRIGPGDSDTISHARELKGPLFMQAVAPQALQFHAWVEAPSLLVDFSTATLPLKAQQLDAADGGKTQVAWAPDYLWLSGARPAAHLRTPADVNQSYAVGVYCYVRHADIEAVVLVDMDKLMRDQGPAIAATVTAYHALCAGQVLHIAGLGDNGVQTEPVAHALTAVPRATS